MPGGVGGGREEQAEHREFGGSQESLYDIIMIDICHSTHVETYRIYTKSEP